MKYTIQKGKFYSNFSLPSLSVGSPTSRTYLFNFDQSCWYSPTAEWNVEGDWNKLLGWSIGLFPHKLPGKPWYKPSSWVPAHHWNSIRIGWRAMGTEEEPRISLCLYTYREGIRVTTTLLQPNGSEEDIYLDTTYKVELYQEDGEVEIGLFLEHGAFLTHQTVPYSPVSGPSYSLKPYFGGSNSAPQTMTLEVSILPQ